MNSTGRGPRRRPGRGRRPCWIPQAASADMLRGWSRDPELGKAAGGPTTRRSARCSRTARGSPRRGQAAEPGQAHPAGPAGQPGTIGQIVTYRPGSSCSCCCHPRCPTTREAGGNNLTGKPGDFRISVDDPPACTVGFPAAFGVALACRDRHRRHPRRSAVLQTCLRIRRSRFGGAEPPCMGVLVSAPTVQECHGDKLFEPLAMRQHATGAAYTFDPNLLCPGESPTGQPRAPDREHLRHCSPPLVARSHHDPQTGGAATPDDRCTPERPIRLRRPRIGGSRAGREPAVNRVGPHRHRRCRGGDAAAVRDARDGCRRRRRRAQRHLHRGVGRRGQDQLPVPRRGHRHPDLTITSQRHVPGPHWRVVSDAGWSADAGTPAAGGVRRTIENRAALRGRHHRPDQSSNSGVRDFELMTPGWSAGTAPPAGVAPGGINKMAQHHDASDVDPDAVDPPEPFSEETSQTVTTHRLRDSSLTDLRRAAHSGQAEKHHQAWEGRADPPYSPSRLFTFSSPGSWSSIRPSQIDAASIATFLLMKAC